MPRRLIVFVQDLLDDGFCSDQNAVICTKFTEESAIDSWVAVFEKSLPKRLLEKMPSMPTGKVVKP